MNFFRFAELFDYDQDVAPESIKSKKKVSLHSFFHAGRIRDEKMLGSGSGIEHPGSATLVGTIALSE
jgi:hypothetical protein